MKFCTILFLFIGFLHVHLVAQEKDTLRVKNISAPISGVEFPKLQMDKDLKASPEIFLNPDFSLKSEPFALKSMNFKFPGDWKIERGTGFLSNNLLEINPKGFFRLSGWNSFYGYYGSKTYQVNNKFFVGTAAFSDRNFNGYSPTPGWSNQTNYGSSLYVGYKFSDKFSVHASFTIQQNGDPWNLNH